MGYTGNFDVTYRIEPFRSVRQFRTLQNIYIRNGTERWMLFWDKPGWILQGTKSLVDTWIRFRIRL